MSTTYGRYDPQGWTHWPDYPDHSFQFLRTLGAAQEGGSAISECFLAASRMTPGDDESWHVEWGRIGDLNVARASDAEARGHFQTARSNWLRAANYYRTAEFFLSSADRRRLMTFDKVEACSHRYLALLNPAGEVVQIPYGESFLDGYFVPVSGALGPKPVLICFGGLDEFKDELLHEMPRHAFRRGFSLLLVDLPGQGATLRRRGLRLILQTEKPVGACLDYLETRADVDPRGIGLYGASLGGFFAPRAASFEHRLACVVSDGAIWNALADGDALEAAYRANPNAVAFRHLMWVTGQSKFEQTIAYLGDFRLAGIIDAIKCPYLITQGDHDFAGLDVARASYEYAKDRGLAVTLKVFSAEETGAAHCQVDNPTLGQEFICDWVADQLRVAQVEATVAWL